MTVDLSRHRLDHGECHRRRSIDMIISRTPFRISFFGGGTDYPAWFHAHEGAVISTTFDKYCYVTCRKLPPFFEHKYRIAYSKVENVCHVDEIEHRAVRAVLQEYRVEDGLEIHCDADLPARSGLGSSSSFVVGMLNAIRALRGERSGKDWLSKEAIRIEQQVLAETVGCQDQVAAAFGGFNIYRFRNGADIAVEPLVISSDRKTELNDHLMLFFTGFSRIASEVAKDQVANVGSRVDELRRMRSMVDEAYDLLASRRDVRGIGTLLHEAWKLKRTLSRHITTSEIDSIYDRACDAGALGGKLLGAGAGGFMLLFVEPKHHRKVSDALTDLINVPFRFEDTGSQIVYYRP